jgi:hypothetical protein
LTPALNIPYAPPRWLYVGTPFFALMALVCAFSAFGDEPNAGKLQVLSEMSARVVLIAFALFLFATAVFIALRVSGARRNPPWLRVDGNVLSVPAGITMQGHKHYRINDIDEMHITRFQRNRVLEITFHQGKPVRILKSWLPKRMTLETLMQKIIHQIETVAR